MSLTRRGLSNLINRRHPSSTIHLDLDNATLATVYTMRTPFPPLLGMPMVYTADLRDAKEGGEGS